MTSYAEIFKRLKLLPNNSHSPLHLETLQCIPSNMLETL